MTNFEDGANTSDLLHIYIRDMERYPLLSHADEQELGRRVLQGDEDAIQALVTHNLRLVVSLANGYLRPAWSLMDIIQEGNLGLLRAARKFDVRRGLRFSTMATWWIRQSIERAVGERSSVIRIPTHIATQKSKLKRTAQALAMELGCEPSTAELAARMDCSVAHVEDIRLWSTPVMSLDAPVSGSDADDLFLGDIIVDTALPLDDQAEHSLLADRVEEALATLSARQQEIIRSRYGLGEYTPRVLEEIGRDMGITRERVRQLQANAEKQLRPALVGVAKWEEGVA